MRSLALPQLQPRRRYQRYVGVDIAAASFTAVWHAEDALPPAARTVAQTAAGLTGFQQPLAATGVAAAETLVVLEATGSYGVALAVHLHAAGYGVSVVNPEPLPKWMQSLPRRSKTDPLDAQGLAQFALERSPPPGTPPPAIDHEVRQRLVARDNLLEMRGCPRGAARNQLPALRQWPVVVSAVEQQFEAVIGALDAQISVLSGTSQRCWRTVLGARRRLAWNVSQGVGGSRVPGAWWPRCISRARRRQKRRWAPPG